MMSEIICLAGFQLTESYDYHPFHVIFFKFITRASKFILRAIRMYCKRHRAHAIFTVLSDRSQKNKSGAHSTYSYSCLPSCACICARIEGDCRRGRVHLTLREMNARD